MVLREFPLNFSVFFQIAINKNICGAGKKQTSLQKATNRLLDPEPSKYSSAKSSLYLDNKEYYQIVYGKTPVPGKNLDAVKECNLYKLAENIISIWLKNEEDNIYCMASLLRAGLLSLGGKSASEDLLNYLKKDHIKFSVLIGLDNILDYLQSRERGNGVTKEMLLQELESSYGVVSSNPFDMLKWIITLCKTVSINITNDPRAVANRITGIVKKEIYPTMHILESIKHAQELIKNTYGRRGLDKFLDNLYDSLLDNDVERQITDEKMLSELESLADYFLGRDSKLDEERDHIYRKANATINLAYVLRSIAVFCTSTDCDPREKKIDLSIGSANSNLLKTYKAAACKTEPQCLCDYVKKVRMLQGGMTEDYLVFLLLVLRCHQHKSIYESRAVEGVPQLSKYYGLYELEIPACLQDRIQWLFDWGTFILQGKRIMPESLLMLGDQPDIENELRTAAATWRAGNTPQSGDFIRYYDDESVAHKEGPVEVPLDWP